MAFGTPSLAVEKVLHRALAVGTNFLGWEPCWSVAEPSVGTDPDFQEFGLFLGIKGRSRSANSCAYWKASSFDIPTIFGLAPSPASKEVAFCWFPAVMLSVLI
jgi:hypothetical protein